MSASQESLFPDMTPQPYVVDGQLKSLAPNYEEAADQRMRDINEQRGNDLAEETTGVGVDTQPGTLIIDEDHPPRSPEALQAIADKMRADKQKADATQAEARAQATKRPPVVADRDAYNPAYLSPELRAEIPALNPDGRQRIAQPIYEATRREVTAAAKIDIETAAAVAARAREIAVRKTAAALAATFPIEKLIHDEHLAEEIRYNYHMSQTADGLADAAEQADAQIQTEHVKSQPRSA